MCSLYRKITIFGHIHTIGGMETLKLDNYVKFVLPPFWNGIYYKRQEFAPFGSKFFPFIVDLHFKKDLLCSKAKLKPQKLSMMLENMAEDLPSVFRPYENRSADASERQHKLISLFLMDVIHALSAAFAFNRLKVTHSLIKFHSLIKLT